MSGREIDAWYRNRLAPEDRGKFEFVVRAIDAAGVDHDTDTIIRVMNHFHADPETPVDVTDVLRDVGVDIDPTPDVTNLNPEEVV